MLLKETGYDEFLAEKIRKGRESINTGKIIELADADKEWQQTIKRKAEEVAEFEKEVIAYG